MKGLKVKKISLFSILVFSILSGKAAYKVSYYLDRPIEMKCVNQKNGNFSLEGHFKFEEKNYVITARRAYSKGWCEHALNKVGVIMSAKKFFLEAEAIETEDTHITIERFSSEKGSWNYFSF